MEEARSSAHEEALKEHRKASSAGKSSDDAPRRAARRRRNSKESLGPDETRVTAEVKKLRAGDGLGLVDCLAVFAGRCLPPPGGASAQVDSKSSGSAAESTNIPCASVSKHSASLDSRQGPSHGRRGSKVTLVSLASHIGGGPQATGGGSNSVQDASSPSQGGRTRRKSMDWGLARWSFGLKASERTEVLLIPREAFADAALKHPKGAWSGLMIAAEEAPDDDWISARLAQEMAWQAYRLVTVADAHKEQSLDSVANKSAAALSGGVGLRQYLHRPAVSTVSASKASKRSARRLGQGENRRPRIQASASQPSNLPSPPERTSSQRGKQPGRRKRAASRDSLSSHEGEPVYEHAAGSVSGEGQALGRSQAAVSAGPAAATASSQGSETG